MALFALILVSALVVFFDARSIGYDPKKVGGLAGIGPVGWLFCTLFLWIIAVPIYLAQRSRLVAVARGEADPVGGGSKFIRFLGALVGCSVVSALFGLDSAVQQWQQTAAAVQAAMAAEPPPAYEPAPEHSRDQLVAQGLATARAAQPIPATTLASDYEGNELASDQRYKGRWLKIQGITDSVAKDMMGSPYIALKGPRDSFRGVQCFLTESAAQIATNAKKGDKVTIVGMVDGLSMNVLVKDCEFW